MHIEVEQKINGIELLENKKGSPASKVLKEMNKLGIDNMPSKKGAKKWRGWKFAQYHKYIKNKKQKKLKFLNKILLW